MGKPSVIFLILVVMGCIFSAGCTQSSGNAPVTQMVPATPVSPPEPEILVPTEAAGVSHEVVTIIRYVSATRDIKDPDLLFTLQVPVEWNVSTHRLTRSDTSDYRTDLAGDNAFSVYTYAVPRSQDQAYRGEFRQWSPAPKETTVTINEITYDRFESASEGKTRVSYVVRRSSANERGYASVLVFTARDSNRFEKEDFEKVVSSFRYFSGRSAGTTPGEEIPLYDSSGNAVSRKATVWNSSTWNSWGGSSSDGDTSGGSSPGGDSSGGGGGGCGCS